MRYIRKNSNYHIMKRFILFLSLIIFFYQDRLFAQQTIYDTLTINNLDRDMIVYVPATYNASTPVPLVFNFHGYTSNAFQQMFYGDFRAIADTANFILVHPNGTLDNTNTTHWNVGFGGSTVDDVSYIDQLIDSLLLDYAIDTQRIYATGMSNGGYFSYRLACELSERITAMASVTGSMTPVTQFGCATSHPMPVMQIHGTADGVVPYAGDTWTLAVEQVVDLWVSFNQCDTTPQVFNVPNVSITDGCTATSYSYLNGINGSEVVLYRIDNGGHTWPGAPFNVGVTNYDFNASLVIWQFFQKFRLDNLILSNRSLPGEMNTHSKIHCFPNPVADKVTISSTSELGMVEVFHVSGQCVYSANCMNHTLTLDLSQWARGMYIFKAVGQYQRIIKE